MPASRTSRSASLAGEPGRLARIPKPARAVTPTMHARVAWLAQISQLEPKDPDIRRRLLDAEAFFAHQALDLASTFGLGETSPAVGQLVRSAALGCVGRDLALERGDWHTFAKLAQSVRHDLVAAHQITLREALAKGSGQGGQPRPWQPAIDTAGQTEEDRLAEEYARMAELDSREEGGGQSGGG